MLNIFQRKMFSCAKMHLMRTFCFALQKCICNILCNKMYASNAFLHQQNVTNAFDAYILLHKMLQMHFGVHFPKENVQQRVHFPKENVQHHIFQRKMFSNASTAFLQNKMYATQSKMFSKAQPPCIYFATNACSLFTRFKSLTQYFIFY